MTMINGHSKIWKLVAVTIGVLLMSTYSGLGFQANADLGKSKEDPYTSTTGKIEVTKKVIDGFLYIKYIYTSEDLHQKYGFQKIYREQIVPLDENYNGSSTETEIAENVKLELIHDSETPNLAEQQKIKNKGNPMYTHEEWKVLDEKPQANVFGALFTLITHVPKWAAKDTSVWVKYDPIDILWSDATSRTDPLFDHVTSYMNSNGWSSSTCITSTTLQVYIASRGGWIPQDAQRYKFLGGTCDQYHVRIWYLNNDELIGAAHLEKVFLGNANLHHIYISDGTDAWENNIWIGHSVQDFEIAESAVKNTFGTGWTKSTNSHSMANEYKREEWRSGSLQVTAYNGPTASIVYRTT